MSKETIKAALRYLLFALFGSVLYLLGTVLIYGAYGTLDIVLLVDPHTSRASRLDCGCADDNGIVGQDGAVPVCICGCRRRMPALRPPAAPCFRHLSSRAPSFLIVRLWFDAMPGLMNFAAAQILATLGSGAILFGSILALRQKRLKLLIAYSTIAQIGYLFFIFPLVARLWRRRSLGQCRLDRRVAATVLSRFCQSGHVHGGRTNR